MRIGINGTALVSRASVAAVRDDVQRAHAEGFASYWLAEHPTGGFDALTVLTAAGLDVPDIELGTAVIPTFPRHPMALAGQVLTAQGAIGERLTLGIGLSHEVMMAQLGIGFDKPIRHLREYLSILMPLLTDGEVNFEGETLSCEAKIFRKADTPPPVVVAALGEQALRVAGHRTDGTTLAWVGPKTIAEHIRPRISEAAAKAGRGAPRIIATLPVAITTDAAGLRERTSQNMKMYSELPSYQAMFKREGVDGPGGVVIAGSSAEVEDQIGALVAAGVTDFAASVSAETRDERAETRELLSRLASSQ